MIYLIINNNKLLIVLKILQLYKMILFKNKLLCRNWNIRKRRLGNNYHMLIKLYKSKINIYYKLNKNNLEYLNYCILSGKKVYI
jgi:hypothetical protein